MKTFILFCSLFSLSVFASEDRLVSVRGEGEMKIKPDLAVLSLQVNSKAKDAKAAQEKNASEMVRVQKVLRDDFKIDAKEIQTTSFSLNPDYRYEQNGKRVFLGFQVNHGLTVKVKKLEKLGDILDKVVSEKNSEEQSVSLGGISFDTEKRKEYELQALEVAMRNALERAEALAKFANKSLRGVRRISDSNISYQPFMTRPMMAKGMMTEMSARDSMTTPIQSGEITVSANVAVEYELN